MGPIEYVRRRGVEDIDAAIDHLREAGVELERYEGFPHDEGGVVRADASGHPSHISWCNDPTGHVLSVIQEA